ncbi:hypothetical protein BGZ76_010401 [Entomortierella beljakovae]|nr:hypothetical protein BGZ76_010401 [Entomortierella beljakovae]
MLRSQGYNCAIVGSTSLVIECAKHLSEAGHQLNVVLPTDEVVHAWAIGEGLPIVSSIEELDELSVRQSIDVLFSIINPILLPGVLLNRIQYAFNYHDGPLPRYAGTHATSWALLEREKRYAVTWHHISEKADTGDIVVQCPVEISSIDTAQSLNLKSNQAASRGFGELVNHLTMGTLTSQVQDLTQRSFFQRSRRPLAGAYLCWTNTAEDLSALARALDFGEHYPNPLTCPKLLLEQNEVQVKQVLPLPQRSGKTPGTLINIEQNAWQVATSTEDVLISGFATLEGDLLSAQALASQYKLYNGAQLPELSQEQTRAIKKIHESLSRSESFWQNRLSQSRPLHISFASSKKGDKASWAVSKWHAPLKSSDESTDPIKMLLSSFAIYLARLMGESQLLIGWHIEKFSETFADLACLSSTVPMEILVDLDSPFAAVSDAITTELALLNKHHTFVRDLIARYPVLQSIEALRKTNPWQIAVSLVSSQAESFCSSLPEPVGDVITLQVDVNGAFRWSYDSNHLKAESIERMSEHLRELVYASGKAGVSNMATGKLNLLTQSEQTLLLKTWNATDEGFPAHLCVHQLFEQQVARTPQATALVYEDQILSYAELNARANHLAYQLIKAGVQPDTCVAICVERSPTLFIGLMAILKAGGAYIPLDQAYPSQRLKDILVDVHPGILLADSTGRTMLSDVINRISTVIDPNDFVTQTSHHNPQIQGLTSRHLAYVTYTSGSTGKPKGVMVEHRGVINFAQAQRDYLGIQSSSRVLQFASISFDVSVSEIVTLGYGASLYIPPSEIRADRKMLWAYLENHAITHATLPPALLQDGNDLPRLSSPLKLVIGGDVPNSQLLQRLSNQLTVLNAYGPTETTIWCTLWQCPPDFNSETVSIGRPLANTRLYILDRHLQPVPLGASGELYIGGIGVARGYLGRPELTAERFLDDPFKEGQQARMYKTGDLVRYLLDGNVEFLGRIDHQVKIRGYRIEPGEIEMHLVNHQRVREAFVLVADHNGDMRLIAYVVTEPETHERLAYELRTYLAHLLPEYMIPAAFVCLGSLPLLPNGKLNRQALPIPSEAAFARRAYEAPKNKVEEQLAAIWTELLNLERISRHDNFFELGGHSLSVVRMAMKIQDSFGIEIPMRMIFEATSIAELAKRLVSKAPNQTQHSEMSTETVNLMMADAALNLKFTGKNPQCSPHPWNYVLLTGATGFVGRYLLAELLHQTNAHIICLVRTKDKQNAKRQLLSTLQEIGQHHVDQSRFSTLDGDLNQPQLGLTDVQHVHLAEKLDVIIHNGAMVNHFFSYQELRQANVLATRTLIQLAANGRAKHLHYISSSSIAPLEDSTIFTEDSVLSSLPVQNGYAQSKWVGEQLIKVAAKQGISCGIFRLGRITADSNTGYFNQNDHFYRILRAIATLGTAFDAIACPKLPVNHATQAMILLMLNQNEKYQVAHIIGHHPFDLDELITYMRDQGIDISNEKISQQAWAKELRNRTTKTTDENLMALLSVFDGWLNDKAVIDEDGKWCSQKTLSKLAKLGFEYPDLNEDYIEVQSKRNQYKYSCCSADTSII